MYFKIRSHLIVKRRFRREWREARRLYLKGLTILERRGSVEQRKRKDEWVGRNKTIFQSSDFDHKCFLRIMTIKSEFALGPY